MESRRRRGIQGDIVKTEVVSSLNDCNGAEEEYYYYDDDNNDEVFKKSCSLGKFCLNPCLCLYEALIQTNAHKWCCSCNYCCHREQRLFGDGNISRQRRRRSCSSYLQIRNVIIIYILLVVMVSFVGMCYMAVRIFKPLQTSSPSMLFDFDQSNSNNNQHKKIRTWLDEEYANRLPIQIKSFGIERSWNNNRFPSFDTLTKKRKETTKQKQRKYDKRKRKNNKILQDDVYYGDEKTKHINDDTFYDPNKPCYGGLIIKSLQQEEGSNRSKDEFKRVIDKNDEKIYEMERLVAQNKMDSVYNNGGSNIKEKYLFDEELPTDKVCQRNNWRSLYYPTCNNFHEVDFSRPYDNDDDDDNDMTREYDTYHFSSGYYRDVWVGIFNGNNESERSKVVYKMLKYKFRYGREDHYLVQRDAIIMEQLTSSPNIINIYGHCASSVAVEALSYEVEKYIVPSSGYLTTREERDEYQLKIQSKQQQNDSPSSLHSLNDYTPTEKLQIALEMAESIKELHEYKGGIIVHGDIQLCQWLRNKDGKLILGDFNRAEILDINKNTKKYCKFFIGGQQFGNYRSPEEFSLKYLTEKIDVYSFGNNIYSILTGLWIYYDTTDDEVAQSHIIDGKQSSFPSDIQSMIQQNTFSINYAEQQLIKLMYKCWEYDPDRRISIVDVVEFLRNAVKENEKLNSR